MPFAASLSTLPDTRAALEAAAGDIRSQLGEAKPDLALLFLSHHHTDMPDLAPLTRELTGAAHLVGCTGETIVGGGREVEVGPALSLWAAVLPGARISTFQAEPAETGFTLRGLPPPSDDRRVVLLFGEPFSCPVRSLLAALAEELPSTPILGGMASGGENAGENILLLDDQRIEQGAVGVLLAGPVQVRSVVSQGCRPIGSRWVITRAQQNVVLELGGKPALERFEEMYGSLTAEERELVHRGLHLGVAMNEYQENFDAGDFLVANVVGADQKSGALALGSAVRTGQTVQFHVRDAGTADADLRNLLQQQAHRPPASALLFSCNGRGTRLFPQPHHDATAVQGQLGPLPLAGFFAQGELGPVGGRNYIHGFTASIALFDET